MGNNLEEIRKRMQVLKTHLAKSVNGDKWLNIEDFKTNGKLDASKYTPEMVEKFKKKCGDDGTIYACMNASCDWCYIVSESCFEDLFNPIPSGLLAFATKNMNWTESTEEKAKEIYEKWKTIE